MNDLACQGLLPDPDTGENRCYSTLAATSLVFPTEALLDYSVARTMQQWNEAAIGQGKELAAEKVMRTLHDAGLLAADLCQTLRRSSMPTLDVLVQPLFRRKTASATQYHRHAVFLQKLKEADQRFKDTHTAEATARLKKAAKAAEQQLQAVLNAVDDVLRRHGLSSASRACQQFLEEFRRQSAAQSRLAHEAETESQQKRQQLAEATSALQGYWFGARTSVQDRCACCSGNSSRTASMPACIKRPPTCSTAWWSA